MPESEQKTPEAVLVQPAVKAPRRSTGAVPAEEDSDFADVLPDTRKADPQHTFVGSFEEEPARPETAFQHPNLQESTPDEPPLHEPSTEYLAEDTTSASDDEASPPLTHELNQSLARLEMNSLQVKLYLDSIEEKISRMEPRLEQIRDGQQPPSDSTQPGERDTLSDPVLTTPATPVPTPPRPAESTTERRRRRFDIPPPDAEANHPLSSAHRLSDDDPWAFKPWLFARRKQLAIAGSVFLAFVAILTFGVSDHPQTPASAALPANTPAPAPAGIVEIPKSSAGIPLAANGASSSSPSAAAPSSTSTSPQSTDPSTDPAISPAGTFPVAASDSPSGTLLNSTASGAPFHDPASTDVPSGARNLPASGRVRVSSGVMAGNLLYSPTPKYPGGFASLFHMQGKVTMQAIIARSGRVENLRVLSGHRLLRGAAQDAVRTWRYRPYAVNGIPVEVATIVTVEFHR